MLPVNFEYHYAVQCTKHYTAMVLYTTFYIVVYIVVYTVVHYIYNTYYKIQYSVLHSGKCNVQ